MTRKTGNNYSGARRLFRQKPTIGHYDGEADDAFYRERDLPIKREPKLPKAEDAIAGLPSYPEPDLPPEPDVDELRRRGLL